ncbi:MAG TPA: 6,7-dimethyl-8-ribityllumazine synthase [Nitrospinae bacterium]|nr:6,7-dimethyl-8-ribityllumazine synthase [Nitrospinota bacterium]
MPETIQGKLDGSGLKVGIVASRFNDFLTKQLIEGALDALTRHGTKDGDIKIVRVPGSFEIPYAASILASSKKYDALICLGVIIRGDTPHYQHISSEVTKGIAAISLETGVPVIYGVLTVENIEQGIERCGTKSGNRGWDAAINAIEMVNLYKQLKK